MALDTRGLASGFAQGFGLMNQYQQQQRQNERADRRLDMQEQKFGLQMETAEMEKEQVQRQRDNEAMRFTLAKAAEFGEETVTEDERALLKKHPEVWGALEQQADPAIQRAIDVFDIETPADANDPESLEQANLLFRDMINKGDGGQKRIVGWYPAPDGESVMLELEVTRPDGTKYRAPMTEGRGTEEDAIVKSVKVEDLVNHIQGLRMIRNGINLAGPEGRQRASRLLQLLRGEPAERWETVQGPDGAVFQREVNSGKLDSVIGRRRSSYYGNRETSNVSEARTLVAEGVYDNFADAYNAVRARAGQDFQLSQGYINFLSDELERIDSQLEVGSSMLSDMPDDEVEELRVRREELAAELDAASRQTYNRPGGGGREPQSGGQRYPQEGDMVGNPDPSAGANDPVRAQGREGPVQVGSAKDYESLPSGSQYIDPDGNLRRKP